MGSVVPMRGWWRDTFTNVLAGLGFEKDKSAYHNPALALLRPDQIEALYRGDWVSRKIVDIPAFDSTRSWRSWQTDKNNITKIEETEKAFNIQRKMQIGLTRARLYGGAALIMGIENQPMYTELDPESVGQDELKFVHVVSKMMLEAGPINQDITSPYFGEPTYYMRSNVPTPPPIGRVEPPESLGLSVGLREGEPLYIHPSRVVRLLGAEYPDWERAPDQWGDSILQPVWDAIKQSGLVNSSIAALIAELKLDIITVPDLSNKMANAEGSAKLAARMSNANAMKSIVNALMIDEKEKWESRTISPSGFDDLMMAYLNICAGASDIPATRLLGRSPAGMNATGESDMRNYYDSLAAHQNMKLRPALARLDKVLLAHTFGKIDDKIHYEWDSLWQMDETQRADINLKAAQAHQIDVNSGLINPDVLRQSRANYLIEDGFLYPGIEEAIDEHELEPDEDEMDQLNLQLMQKQVQQFGKPQPGAPGAGGQPKIGAQKPKALPAS